MKGYKRKRGNGDDSAAAETAQGLAGKLVSPGHRAGKAWLWHRRILNTVRFTAPRIGYIGPGSQEGQNIRDPEASPKDQGCSIRYQYRC